MKFKRALDENSRQDTAKKSEVKKEKGRLLAPLPQSRKETAANHFPVLPGYVDYHKRPWIRSVVCVALPRQLPNGSPPRLPQAQIQFPAVMPYHSELCRGLSIRPFPS
jgi:hypothetical protein